MIIEYYISYVTQQLYEAVRPRVTPANVRRLYRKYVFVESSNIHSIYYEPREKTLRVRFLSGAEYEYYNVPERIFRALLNAQSHGSEFWKLVRDLFDYTRLADFDVDSVQQDNNNSFVNAR